MKTDLIVVGAGIMGLATAYLAHKEGRSVHVIEAAERPVGSSIQNFGHACFTGQADHIQHVADKAREGWLQAAQDVGFWAAAAGTWIPAQTETEMQILREFAEKRGEERVALLSREQVAAGIGNPDLNAVGGAHLIRDARVNPREVAPSLVKWLSDQGVKFTWNTQVTGVGNGTAQTVRGDFQAAEVVVSPGFKLMGLFPQLAERFEVQVCELVMTLIARPDNIRPELGVLTGTSLARYDGFTNLPSAEALRAELLEREPELVGCVANLMMTANQEGIFIGDSHAYSLSADPFISAALSELLLTKGCAVLGIDKPVIKQRWLGLYADSPKTNLVLEKVDPQTTIAVVTSGIGMTLSFGIADLVLRGETVDDF